MPIDLDAVTAVDTHVHVEDDGHGLGPGQLGGSSMIAEIGQ
jgi:hypothetical protein